MKGCQHTVYAFADRNSTTGVATWSEPFAEDNHDSNVVVRKEGSVSPGDRLSAGNYRVVYKATDAAGNKAQSCQTEVVVKSKNNFIRNTIVFVYDKSDDINTATLKSRHDRVRIFSYSFR